jgi:Rieske Fe-S protein
MKNKKITRKDFINKTGKCVGGIICVPMAVSLFQSCDKPDLTGSTVAGALYISECPCHQAQFDQDGSVVQSPFTGDAIASLQQYSTTINSDSFTVSDENGNETEILFSDHESLETVGGVSHINSLDFNNKGLLLYRKSENEIIALSRICTHNGCQIGNFQEA